MTINLTALQKQRRDTAANWTGANPTLLAGEIGIESDTNKIKIGDGSTAWTSLSYTTWSQISAYPIVNADVASAAAIAGTKISPNFGSQTIITTGSGLIGTATALSTTYAGTGKFQVASNTSTVIQTYAFDSTGAAYAPGLELARARGTQASPVIVNNGDYLGEINFYGYNTDFRRAASIHVEVNGTPGSSGDVSDIPGKLIFSTTPDGSATPSARMTIDNTGLVTIPGDLTVNGTTTTINSTTLVVQDKNIEMGVVATPTDVTADGGGITLKGTTDKTINWIDATDAWTFSEHVNIASAKEYRIAGTKVLDATSLGSAVVSSSLTSVGTIGTGVWQGTAIADTYLGTISTALKVSNSATTATNANTASAIVARDASGNFTAGTITANLTGTASNVTTNANLTGDVTSVGNATTIAAGVIVDADINASAAIVDTKLATIATAGKVSNSATTATNANTASAIVARDASGNFTAGTITATLTGNAATVTTNANLTGDVTSVGNATTIAAGVIVNAAINASAAIAGTKISPDFGAQNIVTTGTLTVDTTTLVVDATNNRVGIGTASPALPLHVEATTNGEQTLLFLANPSIGGTNETADISFRLSGTAGTGDCRIRAGKESDFSTEANIDSFLSFRTTSNNIEAEQLRINSIGQILSGQSLTGAELPIFSFSNDTNTGIYNPGADQLAVATNGTQRITIDSSGRLLVGTTTTAAAATELLQVEGIAGNVAAGGAISLRRASVGNTDQIGIIHFKNAAEGAAHASISAICDGTPSAGDFPGALLFSTTPDGGASPVEAMRISNTGSVLIQTTSILSTSDGCYFNSNTNSEFHQLLCHSSSTSGLANLYLNRQATDGTLIEFRQADTAEGTISVSGTTVSYNGGHLSRWSQLPNNQSPLALLKGTLMSNLDEMCEWGNENNEQLNKTKISDTEGDPNVAGLFVSTAFSEDGPLDFLLAMTGDMIIRIGAGVTVERGNLLMSAGDGTAKPQNDDIIRSKTIAKVTSTNVSCTYEDGSYCVPCVLMAC